MPHKNKNKKKKRSKRSRTRRPAVNVINQNVLSAGGKPLEVRISNPTRTWGQLSVREREEQEQMRNVVGGSGGGSTTTNPEQVRNQQAQARLLQSAPNPLKGAAEQTREQQRRQAYEDNVSHQNKQLRRKNIELVAMYNKLEDVARQTVAEQGERIAEQSETIQSLTPSRRNVSRSFSLSTIQSRSPPATSPRQTTNVGGSASFRTPTDTSPRRSVSFGNVTTRRGSGGAAGGLSGWSQYASSSRSREERERTADLQEQFQNLAPAINTPQNQSSVFGSPSAPGEAPPLPVKEGKPDDRDVDLE